MSRINLRARSNISSPRTCLMVKNESFDCWRTRGKIIKIADKSSTSKMPVAVTPTQANKGEREERLLAALKAHILKERQRKKEEYEAEVEEERQRKEREARERQDVMTLGETREQIQKLDLKLKELNNQKQQLFLQLKKVLNEDESRKKQQQQKESEILSMHVMPAQNAPHTQVFLPPRQQQHQPMMQKTAGPAGMSNQPMKRGRSPSPPHQQSYYKSAAYSPSPKHEDSRSRANEMGARVLWKPTQYAPAQGTLFYQTTNVQDSRPQPIIYPTYNPNLNMPMRQNYHIELPQPPPSQAHPQKNDQPPKSAQVYHINVEQASSSVNQPSQQGSGPPPNHKSGQPPQITMEKIQQERGGYHVEVKLDPSHPPPHGLPDGVSYAPLMPGHAVMHPGKWEMQMPPSAVSQSQNAKTVGSITQGYPGRVPPGHGPPQQMQGPQQQQPPPPPQQIHFARRLY